jgi:hypothetical protein
MGMLRMLPPMLLLALLAGCRTESAAQVKCDTHLLPINGADGRGSVPVARTDRKAVGAHTDER